MDHTLQDEKALKTLEDLAIYLVTARISLLTLKNAQKRAIEIGIMKEDMNERSNTIIWDLTRLSHLYTEQLEQVLELLPADFSPQEQISKMLKKRTRKKKDEN